MTQLLTCFRELFTEGSVFIMMNDKKITRKVIRGTISFWTLYLKDFSLFKNVTSLVSLSYFLKYVLSSKSLKVEVNIQNENKVWTFKYNEFFKNQQKIAHHTLKKIQKFKCENRKANW